VIPLQNKPQENSNRCCSTVCSQTVVSPVSSNNG